MTYRPLGRSGLMVSTVGLGTNAFGSRIDAEQTQAVVDAALESGITFFDTSDTYGRGASEELLGRALGRRRADVVVATKFGMDMGGANGPDWGARASRRYVRRALEASLTRLGTDHIDLYQLHQWDGQTPLEETLGALDALVQAGEVRYVGASNHSAWHLMKALGVADTIEVLVDIGSARGVSAAQVALAYILGKPAVTSVVVGARTERQLADNLAAAHLELTDDEVSRLDVVSAQPLQYPYWHQAKTASDRLGPADLSLLGRHLG
jgi:aryl-alcohol dehydrogenase-like predicted oxidoreductase